MRKIICSLISVILLIVMFLPVRGVTAEKAPTCVINVVYDDSGSMYNGVDTWCQAKYAMEVFAAMLGETDEMNVYYMSDFEQDVSSEPRIRLEGKDGAEANVAQIHNQKTEAGNTPFDSVRKAYADLVKTKADKKWLVILTDGVFQGVDKNQGIDSFLSQKPNDMNVVFFGMGARSDGITENQTQNIFYVETTENKQILNKITGICTRIFNSNRLDVDPISKAFSFDVPMGELTVFAQGANVEINGIKKGIGPLIKSSKPPVEVKYSECDASNYQNNPTKDLQGSIVTFKDDFEAGNYSVDVTGAETIEIYYKPNVDIEAYLWDQNGDCVADHSSIAAGEYTISFGFVKAGTNEKVAESKLLGKVTYSAVVTNNENKHKTPYRNGDIISLEEGTLSIDASASYLDYNSVSTHLNYNIYKDKRITFTVENNPQYMVVSEGFQDASAIKVDAMIDGKPFTDEQWKSLEMPTIKLKDSLRDFRIDQPKIEKSDESGVFYIVPQLPNGKPSTGTYKDVDYELNYHQMFGNEKWEGSYKGSIEMQDNRAWWERNWDLSIKALFPAAVLFALAGYLPLFKNYLPKSLKKKPNIKCVPLFPGEDRKDRNGVVEKNVLSTLIPYVSQTGKIRYVPKGVTGCPILEVRAIKRRRITVTNIKSFAGKDYITFDGEAIKKDIHKFETSAGVVIRVTRGTWTYTCSPNQSN